ncbi:MAG TPA: RsmB/NOP family class I SAM-dependent RNA methyltransferase [Polyangiaceae bacterium]
MQLASKGEAGFARHYTVLFGERWPELRQALVATSPKVLRVNGFASEAARLRDTRELTPLPRLPGCFRLESASERVTLGLDEHELLSAYVMDAASVVAARALQVRPGETVLDLCAAPGGKALVLLEALASAGNLTLNDRSRKRSARLKTVLRQYVPANVLDRVKLTAHDARRWGLYQPAAYDAILLDAPCSSERHVLGDPAELAKWSPSRIQRLASDQYAMLAAAATALKPGGRLVYSTCALAPQENDGVIERLLKRARHAVEVSPVSAPLGEASEYGWQIHPDRHGAGPIYFCKLTKAA